ncbi:hypothetical protein FRC16_005555, partial [Serendipita sp. 398]
SILRHCSVRYSACPFAAAHTSSLSPQYYTPWPPPSPFYMLFFRQLGALVWKNWIVLSQHWFLNLLRCLVLPIGFGVFLATAQLFLIKPDNLGIGPPGPIHSLAEQFQSEYHFYWVDSTNGSATPAPRDIMDRVSLHFSPSQKAALKQLESEEAVTAACEQNFNGYSDCWTAIIFNDIDGFSGVNYTIRADAGLRYINVEKHTSDYEVIVLPVQWALDSAIISLQTNQYPATPQEAPFTGQTNEEQARDIREAYIGGIQALFVLVFFIAFLGVPYHLPGSFMGERASLTTAHMQQMGVLDSARIISWQLSISLAYLPAYILMGIIWKTYVFTHTSTGLLIIVNILTCFSLASWSMLVAAPFGKSPQLAAIASTFLAILLAIMALVVK